MSRPRTEVYEYEVTWKWDDRPDEPAKIDYVTATSEGRAKENLIHRLLDEREDARQHLEAIETRRLRKSKVTA